MPSSTEPIVNRQLIEGFSSPVSVNFYSEEFLSGISPSEKIALIRYLKKTDLILDLGCGTGRILIPLRQAGYNALGLDFSQSLLMLTHRNLGTSKVSAPLVLGDWQESPFRDEALDATFAFGSIITYFKQDSRRLMLKEAHRMLKEGGFLILLVSNSETLFGFPYSLKLPELFRFVHKIKNEKTKAFWLMILDMLSVSVPSAFIDFKRSLFSNISQGRYKGCLPRERVRAASKMPHTIYRLKDLQKDLEGSGLCLIDVQSDWEMVFESSLPEFLRKRSPITYYFIQKLNPHPSSNQRLDDVLPLLSLGLARPGGYEFQITHNSMSPFFMPGDIACGRPADSGNLHTGDVLILKSNGSLIAHRLIARAKEKYRTKGDNSKRSDPLFCKEDIAAKISSIKASGRFINLENRLWKASNQILALISRLEEYKGPVIIRNIFVLLLRLCVFVMNPDFRFLSLRKSGNHFEKEILARLCQKTISKDNKIFLEGLTTQIPDWHQFFSLALYNNIGPLIFRNTQQINIQFIPPWIIQNLRGSYAHSFLTTAPFYKDLKDFLKEVSANNIQIIILKGASLGESVYEDTALRPLKDIDILAKREDWPALRTILDSFGYKNKDGLDLLELDRLSPSAMDRHVAYENSRGTKLEFKFNLFALDFPDFKDTGKYWERAIEQKIADTDMLVLGPEDQILYLCGRMVNAGFQYFLWFVDLHELLSSESNIHWKWVAEQAKQKGISSVLYHTLTILKETFPDTPVPEEILNILKPGRLKQAVFSVFFPKCQRGFRPAKKRSFFPDPMITHCLLSDKFPSGLKSSLLASKIFLQTMFPPQRYAAYRYRIPLWQAYLGRGYLRRVLCFIRRILFL